jgi:hypothetical protein
MDKDQPAWLPEPPPPRPARRDAAIEAALRRFDGEDSATADPERGPSWASTHRPQLAMLVSAMLLVVIGVPAVLIGLRGPPSTSGGAPPATATYDRACTGNDCARQPQAQPELASREEIAPLPAARTDETPSLDKDRSTKVQVASNEPAAEAAPSPAAAPSTSAAPVVAAAPPPPPAKVAAGRTADEALAQDVVTTGARIRNPAPIAEQGFAAKGAGQIAGGDAMGYAVFLSRLQAAVRADDRRAITGMIAFPLRVNAASGTRTYRDAPSVERDFARIFTPRVRQSILAQRADQLFVRDQGAMIGNGEVWFDHTCPNPSCSPAGPVRITAVNP